MTVLVIAEVGVNHNGSLDRAMDMVDAAVEAGANVVKFQSFNAELVVSKSAPKADYQKRTTDAEESQIDMVRKLELNSAAHHALLAYCRQRKIEFLSTPFDLPSVELLAEKLGLSILKIPSGEATNAPLLLKAAQTGADIILSTGMCTLKDVKQALGVLAFGFLGTNIPPSRAAFAQAYNSNAGRQRLREKVRLLHATTEYPAPFEDVNLRAMETLHDVFALPVGLSDHTRGFVVAIAAVARGAIIIEKHFTLDRSLPGPDHKASLEPGELKEMVNAIRTVELALGDGKKRPAPSEQRNILVARKSLIAAKNICKGETFTEENLTTKRPGNGISPMEYWDWLGRKADQDYQADALIQP